jgi:putative oxidoreductase
VFATVQTYHFGGRNRANTFQREIVMSVLVEKGDATGAAVLRVSLGIMFLAHSVVLKLYTFGLAGTAGYFASLGLPASLAYVVFAAEAIGGALLLANVATGWVSLALIPVLAGAFWVHAGNGWVFSAEGGGWEYPLFLIIVTAVVAIQAFAANARTVGKPAVLGNTVRQV